MAKHIPVVLCFDDNFAPFAAVTIFSAFLHSDAKLRFYCVSSVRDEASLSPIYKLRDKFNIDVRIVPLDNPEILSWRPAAHIPPSAYIRLLIPNLIHEKKAIYLDCDVIVQGDLAELFETDLGGAALAGVHDPAGQRDSHMPLPPGNVYINSGVLLLDLQRLKEDEFFEKCKALYEIHAEDVTFCDQCVINKYAENDKLVLDDCWNRQVFSRSTDFERWRALSARGNSKIVHFVGPVKPWHRWCQSKMAEFWWGYADKLDIEGLKPTQFRDVHDLVQYSDMLERNLNFPEAVKVKNIIIESLASNLGEALSKIETMGASQAAE